MARPDRNQQALIEERFLESLRSQLAGLRTKVERDFSRANFEHELAKLKRDSVYPAFAFDTPEYVLIRLMSRISISIGRRIGELYDKTPRFVAAARFNLAPEQVAPKVNRLELDIGLRFSQLSSVDADYVRQAIGKYLQSPTEYEGVGIEIRYNFNPNDSARLRKDVNMAEFLLAERFLPIYLIFSTISPRNEAIARLQRAGWTFLVGKNASDFTEEVFGLNLAQTLDSPKVKAEVQEEVGDIMKTLINSYAFKEVLLRHEKQ